MANLGLQEPSTITARVATVTIARGSTTEHQEILVVGDPTSSNGLARVLGSTPASTEFGLAVRVVEQPSTTVNVSSLAGAVVVRSSAASALFTAYQSSAADLNVTVAGYSTTVNVSSVAGKVQVVNSSAADFNVTVAGYVAPSTVMTVSTGSVRVHQSSAADLNVTVAGYSTTVNVSSVSGVVVVNPLNSSNSSVYMSVRLTDGTAFLPLGTDYTDGSTYSSLTAPGLAFNNSSNNTFRTVGLTTPFPVQVTDSSNAGVKPGDSANNAIRVNVVAGSAASTIVTVSTGSVRVHQSSAADLNVTVAGYSTTANVSSVAGIVAVRPSDTNWASSAGFHFDSSGALQTVASFTGSTTVSVSTGSVGLSGVFDSSGTLQKVGDSVNAAVRVNVVAGSAASTIVTVSTGSVRVHQSSAADLNVTVAGYVAPSTIVTVSTGSVALSGVVDSSGTLQKVGDSVNAAVRVNVVAGSAASTIVTVSTGSVRVHQSSAADLNVTVAGYSTTANISSVAGKVAVVNSSAADFNVTVAGYSTTVNVSSIAGAVIVRSSAADHLVTVYQSTASALLMTATIGTNLQSTAAPSSGSSGLVVRQVIDAIATFASTSALASTTVAVVSTTAGIRAYVTAYTITSTNQTPAHWGFFSSNANLLWPITLAALSSGVAGANLAVSAPGYLFRTNVAEALNFKTAGSTVSGVQMGVSYFLAP